MAIPTVSEKTLELNICEEILADLRKEYPNAFWYGPSTREERDLGYDAGMEGVEGYALFLQFKRTTRYHDVVPKDYPFWFEVSTRQHKALCDLSSDHPGSVKYAFPLIGNMEHLRDSVPNLDGETFYALLDDVGPLDSPQRHTE